MKKLLSIIAILSVLTIITACGGFHNTDKISVKDSISDKILNFPLQIDAAVNSGTLMTFSIDKSSAELSQIFLNNQNDYTVDLCNDKIILLHTKDSCFIIGEIEKSSESPENMPLYAICSPIGTFTTGTSADSQLIEMYIPYHLFDIVSFSDVFSKNDFSDDNVTFNTSSDIKAFYEFYSGLECYDVIYDNNSIIITDIKSGYKISAAITDGKINLKIV